MGGEKRTFQGTKEEIVEEDTFFFKERAEYILYKHSKEILGGKLSGLASMPQSYTNQILSFRINHKEYSVIGPTDSLMRGLTCDSMTSTWIRGSDVNKGGFTSWLCGLLTGYI